MQLLALRLSCSAHSLYKDIKQNYLNPTRQVPTKILTDVANTVAALKPLVNWLNRFDLKLLCMLLVICYSFIQYIILGLHFVVNHII